MKSLTLILIVLSVFCQNNYSDSDMTHSITEGRLTFKWKISDDGLSIEFGCIFSRKSWFGIGFLDVMSGADMIIIELTPDGNKVTVTDYNNPINTGIPLIDAVQDVTLISYTITDSQISVRFSRKLNTNDINDRVLATGEKYTFSYASSGSPTIFKHTTARTFEIADLGGSMTDDSSHGNIMALGLMTIMMLS